MLSDLPTELLDHIVSYSPAASIANLSQSSRALHNFAEKEGWRTFTETNFPALKCPPYWRDAARSLTTLSRNWQRRAFLARFLEPAGDITAVSTGLPVKKWKRPGGQTMGFQPAIDSYETVVGHQWNHRREVVAWSAGAELIVRVRLRTTETEEAYRNASPQARRDHYDASGTRIRWWSYRPFSAVEGKDDITTIKIIRPRRDQPADAQDADEEDQIIIGTANGDLQMIQIAVQDDGPIKTYFVTNGVSVRSSSLYQTNVPDGNVGHLLAANLSDSKLALYNVESGKFKIAPASEIDVMPERKQGCRIWSTRFLDQTRLAVGLGPSTEPIHIFEIRPEGIVQKPIRKLGLGDNFDSLVPDRASSTYPIETLVDANGNRGDGNVLVSGSYDGIIRLHDLRSPRSSEMMYHDSTDDAAIYSLLPRGRDKIIAGTARHCMLKIFDFRVSGGSKYDYTTTTGGDEIASPSSDWNIFINPRELYVNSSWRGPNSWMRRSAEGSVYSLSSPSHTSPFIYAGVENAVVEFNFSSVHDRHPDPIFATLNDPRSKSERPRVSDWFGDKRDVLNLAMYTQGADMRLSSQLGIDETLSRPSVSYGFDERWSVNV